MYSAGVDVVVGSDSDGGDGGDVGMAGDAVLARRLLRREAEEPMVHEGYWTNVVRSGRGSGSSSCGAGRCRVVMQVAMLQVACLKVDAVSRQVKLTLC